MNLKEYPTSITKVMTAMLALEKGSLNALYQMKLKRTLKSLFVVQGIRSKKGSNADRRQ
jgi:D-alanyl-D-alanine carboxypeptidase